MPVSPQLPSGWIPIEQRYTGTDPKLQALQRLRDNVDSVKSDTKGPDNPLFVGVDESKVRAWGILPDEPHWQPTAVKTRQRQYLDDCIVIRALELLSSRKTYDAGFREWLQEKHRLESVSVDDAFQLENVDKLDEIVTALDKERKGFVWPVPQVPIGPPAARAAAGQADAVGLQEADPAMQQFNSWLYMTKFNAEQAFVDFPRCELLATVAPIPSDSRTAPAADQQAPGGSSATTVHQTDGVSPPADDVVADVTMDPDDGGVPTVLDFEESVRRASAAPDNTMFSGRLYLRPCYSDLFQLIHNRWFHEADTDRKLNLAVRGTAGIGKSMFGLYTLWRLADLGMRVLFTVTNAVRTTCMYLFTRERVYSVANSVDFRTLPSSLQPQAYVCDNCLPPSHKPAASIVVVIASAGADQVTPELTMLSKPEWLQFVMPVCTVEELEKMCSNSCSPALEWHQWWPLYCAAGGVIRSLTRNRSAFFSSLEQSLSASNAVKALGDVRAEAQRRVGQNSHSLIHMANGVANGASSYLYAHYVPVCASKYIAGQLHTMANNLWREEYQAVLKGSLAHPSAAFYWEMLAHDQLARGGTFLCKQLQAGNVSSGASPLFRVTIPPRATKWFDCYDQLGPAASTVYWRPVVSNFGAVDALMRVPEFDATASDGIDCSSIGFQMTIADEHAISWQGLQDTLDTLQRGPVARLVLFFVVPASKFSTWQRAQSIERKRRIKCADDGESKADHAGGTDATVAVSEALKSSTVVSVFDSFVQHAAKPCEIQQWVLMLDNDQDRAIAGKRDELCSFPSGVTALAAMVPAPLRLNAWRVGKPPISEMHQCLGVLGKGLSGLAQDYIDWFRANKLCACSDSTWVYNAADAVGIRVRWDCSRCPVWPDLLASTDSVLPISRGTKRQRITGTS